MKTLRHSARARIAAVGLATSGALLLAGCGASNEAPAPGAADTGAAQLSGEINGVGASSQTNAVNAWVAGFNGENPGVTVNYDPQGSGAGREQFIAGGSDFGGSDAFFDEEELPQAQERCGGTVLEIPLYVSPIAVAFNLPGVETVNMSPATIAGIFAGQITQWNGPELAADNPGVTLPDLPIVPVHRSDGSGTTENFVEYLQANVPDVWTYEVGDEWPAELPGEAGAQGQGVAQAVAGGEGYVGYIDASLVGELGVANVGVGEEFVPFTPEAAAAVVAASQRVEGRGEGSFAIELDRTSTASGTYPIVLVSYSLACGTYPEQETADNVKAFLTYAAGEAGQSEAAAASGSAPITEEQRTEYQAAIDGITAGG